MRCSGSDAAQSGPSCQAGPRARPFVSSLPDSFASPEPPRRRSSSHGEGVLGLLASRLGGPRPPGYTPHWGFPRGGTDGRMRASLALGRIQRATQGVTRSVHVLLYGLRWIDSVAAFLSWHSPSILRIIRLSGRATDSPTSTLTPRQAGGHAWPRFSSYSHHTINPSVPMWVRHCTPW